MRAGLRCVAVLEAVVVVVLDRVLVLVQGKGPEAIEIDLVAEAGGQGVHEQAGGGSLDVHLVGQPVPAKGQRSLLFTWHTKHVFSLQPLTEMYW